MHPPSFRPTHRLSDWPDCTLETNCCKGAVMYPVKLLLKERGDMTFDALLARMKCRSCGSKPAPVYLCASHHRELLAPGPSPDWAVQLVSRRT